MVINIDDNVLIDKQGHLGWLTLLKQTLTPEFRFAFFKAMTQLENDKDIRVIILKSAAENIFFAGADIKGMNGDGSEPEGDVLAQIRAGMADSYRVMERLEYSSKPSIAAIDGAAVGGGCELTVACDITIASERAKFGLPEVKLGLIASAGGTTRLPKRIGKQKAMELMLTGRLISAQEAWQIGLVNRVVPAESLYTEVEKIGLMISANAPIAVQATKAVVAYSESILEKGLGPYSIDMSLEKCWTSQDIHEGTKAFVEKRKPQFKGI